MPELKDKELEEKRDDAHANANYLLLHRFLPKLQTIRLHELLSDSEEWEGFADIVTELKTTFDNMPRRGASAEEADADKIIVHAHYFYQGSDWWVMERESEDEEGSEYPTFFAFVRLGGMDDCAELGYFSPTEFDAIVALGGIELDFHWDPLPLGEVKKRAGLK